MMIPLNGTFPQTSDSAFVAPNCTLIGDVSVGPWSSVWYGAVARADMAAIIIGARSNVQDNCVLHTDNDRPCIIGDDVTIGHSAIIHGCTIENKCLIGMGAIILNGAVIGEGSLVGAGALVTQGTKIPPNSLVIGSPARVKRQLTPQEAESIGYSAREYVSLAAQHGKNMPKL